MVNMPILPEPLERPINCPPTRSGSLSRLRSQALENTAGPL
nr:MAG TPA: hypothetical protein [Bacteriophage sp.]